MISDLFLLRLGVGIIFIYHSIPKLKEPNSLAGGIGWTKDQVLGLGIIEFMSGLALIGGVATHLASLSLMIVMAGAIYYKIKKWNVPFFAHDKTGWEFDFILFLSNLTIYLR